MTKVYLPTNDSKASLILKLTLFSFLIGIAQNWIIQNQTSESLVISKKVLQYSGTIRPILCWCALTPTKFKAYTL